MKIPNNLLPRRSGTAFTLIELIVVIAIIGILAGLLFPIIGMVNRRKQISLAQAELKDLEAAIDGYKTKLGYYPPDNPTNVVVNPLYFELSGTTNNGAANGGTPTLWVTLDGAGQLNNSGLPNITSYFGITGLANTSTRAHSDDAGAAATPFIKNLAANQVGPVDPANPLVKILVCPIAWPSDKSPRIASNPDLNPWCYDSSHPTNNTGTYDLWVDLVIRNKTNRICNWSTDPIIL